VVGNVLGSAIRRSLVAAAPIAISVALVSLFTRAGTTVLFQVGPFDATLEGLDFAAQVVLRLFVLAMALAVFGLTTEPRALVADLERRGVSPRLTFVAAAALEAVPALVERARTIQAAQRSRGLDTEGSIGARLRGLVPLVAPVLLSSLNEVEERSLALEARAFGRPGRRELLWTPTDTTAQRALRWGLAAGLLLLAVVRVLAARALLP